MKKLPPQPKGVHIVLDTNRVDGEWVWKYRLPRYLPTGIDAAETIDTARKAAVARRDEMLAFQKACGEARDREGAKFFKEEAADALKEYRAACLLLPLFMCEPPGDCPYKEEYEWPIEIAPWIDRVASYLV